jgi:hypothetical protein
MAGATTFNTYAEYDSVQADDVAGSSRPIYQSAFEHVTLDVRPAVNNGLRNHSCEREACQACQTRSMPVVGEQHLMPT